MRSPDVLPCRSPLGMIVLLGITLGWCTGCASSGQSQRAAATGFGAMADPDLGTERNSLQARKLRAPDMQVTYDHDANGPLPGSRWVLVSVESKRPREAYLSKTVEFISDGRLVTTTTYADGAVETTTEQYRVNGNELLVTTEKFLVNTTYALSGDELIVTSGDFRAVLRRSDR